MQRHFGNYILHERVGIGGMGEVFRATKHGPDGFEVQVALKIILSHLAEEESFRSRFSREARLAASLKHPNIVQVNGFDIVDGTPYIEMEYVHGCDLRKILRSGSRNGKLTAEESVVILHAVARGLDHAHHQRAPEVAKGGIVHCDLNPHNILISTLGEVKVADFGIARALQADATASATVRGKLAYMSPEQMEGRELDQGTDLFSLGIIAYQLLSWSHPFERASEAATIAAIGKAEHLPLGDAVEGLPPFLCEMVDQLLSLQPRDRPGSAASISRALEPLLLPAAVTSLSERVDSLISMTSGAVSTFKDVAVTAPTLPRSRIRPLWPYLIAGTIVIVLTAVVLLLPAGVKKKSTYQPVESDIYQTRVTEPLPERLKVAMAQTVTIQSFPAGARILADGFPIGFTPTEIRRGRDGSTPDLEARFYGYRNKPFRIPHDDRDRFLVTLEPLPTGTVRISARPWARVSFRGADVGETPVIIDNVPVGQHDFILSYGPLKAERRVTREIKEGINTVSVDMRERP